MSSSSSRDMNVSDILANLNHIDSGYPNSTREEDNNNADLSLFANTHFFDFDMGRSLDLSADDLMMQQEKIVQKQDVSLSQDPTAQDSSFVGQYSIAQGLPPAQQAQAQAQAQQQQQQPFNTFQVQRPSAKGSTSRSSTAGVTGDVVGEPASKKRKASSAVSFSPEESGAVDDSPDSRLSAEEDKRRRNTAASARFRMKKKMREQEMERKSKDLQDKVGHLETKVKQLEMENRWLRNLVVEKNEARDVTSLMNMKNKVIADIKTESTPSS